MAVTTPVGFASLNHPTSCAGRHAAQPALHDVDTLAFRTMSGGDIIDKFGYRECPKKWDNNDIMRWGHS